MPVSQFPNVAPPTVTVTANYPGASAEAVETTVTTPLEREISTIQGLRYVASTSGSDGSSTITCSFELNSNLDQAGNDVQNAVNRAVPILPQQVSKGGISVSRNSSALVLTLAFLDTSGALSREALTSYVESRIMPALQRLHGVANIAVFGERRYAMRIWLDPRRLERNGLTPGDVVSALEAQNAQIATGALGAAPTTGKQLYEYSVTSVGRLRTAEQFEHILLRANPDGGFVRVRDVGHVELGSDSYSDTLSYNGQPAVGLGIAQAQNGNAIEISREALRVVANLAGTFPRGFTYRISFDRSAFVAESLREVVLTLLFAIAIVICVIFAFLQSWRLTLIPAITIPVSLLGTLFAMKILDFSVNTLTLLGLLLATGLVVDDAIVVVDNAERTFRAGAQDRFTAVLEAMRDITRPIIAASISLLAVFVPVSMIPGMIGILYKQFALTIACSIVISLFTALTLAPVLTMVLTRAEHRDSRRFAWLNRPARVLAVVFAKALRATLTRIGASCAVFIAAVALTLRLVTILPTSFIPSDDQAFIIVTVQAPSSYSFDQTAVVRRQVETILQSERSINGVFDDAGYSFVGNGSNYATMFATLTPWNERSAPATTASAILRRLNARFASISNVEVHAFNPSSIPGLGYKAGFALELEDRAGLPLASLEREGRHVLGEATATGSAVDVASEFRIDKPAERIDVRREEALQSGVDLQALNQSLEYNLASFYVNDFDLEGRNYRVYVQADAPFRSGPEAFDHLYVWSGSTPAARLQLPVSTFLHVTPSLQPNFITHFNGFRSIEISGTSPTGTSSGKALAAMDKVAAGLPREFGYEWSGIALEESRGTSVAVALGVLGALSVFLVLAAQYQSFLLPLIVMLSVPLALLGAAGGIWLRHSEADVFAQIGYLVLIGLSTKNAILIVEVADTLRRRGYRAAEAVTQATLIRLRPILMTSIAFILGVAPLALANGPGSGERQSLGTVVVFGAALSTILNLFATPIVYVVVDAVRRRTPSVLARSERASEMSKTLTPEQDAAPLGAG